MSTSYGADFGAPPPLGTSSYVTGGGIEVTRTVTPFQPDELTDITRQSDVRRGGTFSSGMEYPGRYSRWHTGYVDPCIEIVARGRRVIAAALNARGAVLLPAFAAALGVPGGTREVPRRVAVVIPEPGGMFTEEERSRRPTVFTALREIIALLSGPDPHLGLYGAFGYDLAFQFEPLRLRPGRNPGQRDLVLHLPDELYVIDRKRETALRYSYEFALGGRSTAGLDRLTPPSRPAMRTDAGAGASVANELPADPEPGSYAKVVELARKRFAAGDLFEVVPSHEFFARCDSPAACYELLRQRNPAPYEFFLNLGEGEYLVGASPEMYVRVTGDRVETCPIAGTIARGADPLGDADAIRSLLTSVKDESELTMCTDVDRNDKSRVCVPGSVKVIGRRQIELYSRLIHTVDHVEGRLRPGFDALDAFLTHMWAVTVTGAPKAWAMQFIEDNEAAPRRWYGGAVGMLGFDGSMNTGLTLRTAHVRDGIASVRTGATLLFDSDPAAEEDETRLKARALLDVLAAAEAARAGGSDAPSERSLRAGSPGRAPVAAGAGAGPGDGSSGSVAASPARSLRQALTVLLVDHQDSFVHTLAGYFAQQGARVTTLRAGFAPDLLDQIAPHLVVLSPGPGRPADFACGALLDELDARRLPAFGVCLGLQAMVEHAGGTLSLLRTPAHGKPGCVRVTGGDLFAGVGAEFTAGRYHSLFATADQVRGGFAVTAVLARGDDLPFPPAVLAAGGDDGQGRGGSGVVMAIEDHAARRWAVQFHPESIMTASGGAGHQVIANVLRLARGDEQTHLRAAHGLGGRSGRR